jgi:hypothetical protein
VCTRKKRSSRALRVHYTHTYTYTIYIYIYIYIGRESYRGYTNAYDRAPAGDWWTAGPMGCGIHEIISRGCIHQQTRYIYICICINEVDDIFRLRTKDIDWASRTGVVVLAVANRGRVKGIDVYRGENSLKLVKKRWDKCDGVLIIILRYYHAILVPSVDWSPS